MSLRGAKAAHREAAEQNMREVRYRLGRAMEAIKKGNCTAAYTNVLDMWHALGQARANGYWAGGTPWEPTTDIEELGYQFSQRCVRDEPITLGSNRLGRAKRRRRR